MGGIVGNIYGSGFNYKPVVMTSSCLTGLQNINCIMINVFPCRIAVKVCPMIEANVNTQLNTTVAIYNTRVNISCDPGFYLPEAIDGKSYQWMVIWCKDDEEWSQNMTLFCIRK